MEDLRLAVRILLKNPSFTLAAVLTLGLGIALNTCAFGVVNALWFRPMAIRDDASVAVIGAAHAKSGTLQYASLLEFAAWTARGTAFERTAAFLDRTCNLSGAGADAAARATPTARPPSSSARACGAAASPPTLPSPATRSASLAAAR